MASLTLCRTIKSYPLKGVPIRHPLFGLIPELRRVEYRVYHSHAIPYVKFNSYLSSHQSECPEPRTVCLSPKRALGTVHGALTSSFNPLIRLNDDPHFSNAFGSLHF